MEEKMREKEELVDYGKKIHQAGLSDGTSGNLSVYFPDKKIMAISPSGIEYEKMTPEDIVLMDLSGKILEGRRLPSSEWMLHAELYKRKIARAIIHTHPPYASVFAVLRKPLGPIHAMIANLHTTEIPCAEYRIYGSEDLAKVTVSAMEESRAVLMANHGLLVYGENLEEALRGTETVEVLARLTYRAMAIGSPHFLSQNEVSAVLKKLPHYGQKNEKGVGETDA